MTKDYSNESVIIERLYLAFQLVILLVVVNLAFPLLSSHSEPHLKIYGIAFGIYVIGKLAAHACKIGRPKSILLSIVDGVFISLFILLYTDSNTDFHDLFFVYIIMQGLRYQGQRPLFFSFTAAMLHTADSLLLHGTSFLNAEYSLSMVLYLITGFILSFAFKQINTLKQERHFYYDEIQKKNAELQRMASTDFLTGLCNHKTFYMHFDALKNQSLDFDASFSLALLDIDDFKRINDTYGHIAGDHVLKVVAKVLKANVRHTDIVARYGGEEFAVLFPATALQDAVMLSERICRAIANHTVRVDNHHIPVTVSIGIDAYMPEKAPLPKDRFIETVDTLLYQAKKAGKNQVMSRWVSPDYSGSIIPAGAFNVCLPLPSIEAFR